MTKTVHTMRRYGVGAIAFLLILGSFMVAAVTAASQYRMAECQAELNGRFLEVLSSRGDLADDDRENLADTITTVSEADDQAEVEDALADYRARYDEISAERQDYPPIPDQVCN